MTTIQLPTPANPVLPVEDRHVTGMGSEWVQDAREINSRRAQQERLGMSKREIESEKTGEMTNE